MTTVVPIRRAAPTAGKRPRRTSQSRSYSAFTAVNATGSSAGRPPRRAVAAHRAARPPRSAARDLDEQRAGALRERAEHRREPGLRLDRAERGAVHHLDRGDPPVRAEPLRPARGGLDVREEDERARLVRVLLHRLERDLGDEGERPLRPDHEVDEDVDRILEVDEGVEAVPGGVLDPVLLADARRERRVGEDLAAELGEPVEERACGRANAARDAGSPVSTSVPSARTSFIARTVR